MLLKLVAIAPIFVAALGSALAADSENRLHHLCKHSAEVGPCREYRVRWCYNKKSKKCEEFLYGGCGGNTNNFQRSDLCKNLCETKIQPGVNITDEVNLCTFVPEEGPCQAKLIRWYYNVTNECCQQFTFGGCGGNANNFVSKKLCRQYCELPGGIFQTPKEPVTRPPVSIEKETVPDTTACVKLLTKLKEMKKIPEGQVKPQCTKTGHFNVMQCDVAKSVCWCVDPEDGEEVPGTRLLKAKGQPKCGACLHAKSKMLDDLTKRMKVAMVECDISGNFQPIQCNAEEGYCWCVHTDSGEVVYGTKTKTDKGQPDCTAEEFDTHRYFYFENVGCSESTEKGLAKCYKTFRQSFPKIMATASPLSIYSLIYNMMYNGQYRQGCEHYHTYSKCASTVLKEKHCLHYGHVITAAAFSYICQPDNQKFFVSHTKCLRKWIKTDDFGKCKAHYHSILTKLLVAKEHSDQVLCEAIDGMLNCVRPNVVKTCDLQMWNMMKTIMDKIKKAAKFECKPPKGVTAKPTKKPPPVKITTEAPGMEEEGKPTAAPAKKMTPKITTKKHTVAPGVKTTGATKPVPGKTVKPATAVRPHVTTAKLVPGKPVPTVTPGEEVEATTVKHLPAETVKPHLTTRKLVPGKPVHTVEPGEEKVEVTTKHVPKKPHVTTPKHVPAKPVHTVPSREEEVKVTTVKHVPGKTVKPHATTPKHVPGKPVHTVAPGEEEVEMTTKHVPGKPHVTTPKHVTGKTMKPHVTTPKHVPGKPVHTVAPGIEEVEVTTKHVPEKPHVTTPKHVPGKTVKPHITTPKHVPGKPVHTLAPGAKEAKVTTVKHVPGKTVKPHVTTPKRVPGKPVHTVAPEEEEVKVTTKHVPGKPHITTSKLVPGKTIKPHVTTPMHVPGKPVHTVAPGEEEAKATTKHVPGKPHVTTLKPVPGKPVPTVAPGMTTAKHVPGKPHMTTPKHVPGKTVKPHVTAPEHVPGKPVHTLAPEEKPEVTTAMHVPGKTVKPHITTEKHVPGKPVHTVVPGKEEVEVTTVKHVPGKPHVTTPKHVPGKTVKPHVTTPKHIPGKPVHTVAPGEEKVKVTTVKHVPGKTVKPHFTTEHVSGKPVHTVAPEEAIEVTTAKHVPGKPVHTVRPGVKVTTSKHVPGKVTARPGVTKKPGVTTPKHIPGKTVVPIVPGKKPHVEATTPKHVKVPTGKPVEKVEKPTVEVVNKTVEAEQEEEGVPTKHVPSKVTHVPGVTKVSHVTKKPGKVTKKPVPGVPTKKPMTTKHVPGMTTRRAGKLTPKPGVATKPHVPAVKTKAVPKPYVTTTATTTLGCRTVPTRLKTMATPTSKFVVEKVSQITPETMECAPMVEHWKTCLSSFITATNFLSGSLTDLTLISSRWSNIFDICQHYYNYDACMSMRPDAEMSDCVPFGHTALSGYVGNVCNREVMRAMRKHGACITRYLANETDLSDCVQTFVDFFNLSYTSVKPQRGVCHKVGGMHSCISRFMVDKCQPEAQSTLAKVKLGCYHTSSQLCENMTLIRDHSITASEVGSNIVLSWSGECASKQAKALKSGHVGDFVPRCEENGDYSLVQCDNKECWCVDIKTGEEAPNTRKAGTEGDVHCGRCHLEQAAAAKAHKKSVPSCQNNGRYQPLQCDYTVGECWCVEVETGKEINATRVGKNQKLPNCGMKNEFSCRPLARKSKCMPDGSKPLDVLRWFKDGKECRVYKVSFCPNEAHLPPFSFRYQSDCEEMCLGPYANRLPVRL